jgi:thiol:disulfide interchange protein
MKRFFILLLFLFILQDIFAVSLPEFIQKSGQFSEKNEIFFIGYTITIPKQSYIYANPKGPGIGKPLSISFTQNNCDIGSTLIDAPVKYTPVFDLNFVWVYRDKIEFYVPVRILDSGSLSIIVEGLMCTTSGSCIPFTINTITKLRFGKSHGPEFPTSKKLIIWKSDPDKSILSKENIQSLLQVNKAHNQPNQENNIYHGSESIKMSDFSPRYLSGEVHGIWWAILFGMIAGLILNFMPCVLPVLSLKALSFARQASDKSGIVKQGLSYTGGVIGSFLILASLTAFAGYSWGSLFQRNEFTLIIILVLFVLSLSLLGLFNFQIPGFVGKASTGISKNSLTDSFLKGLLAALLATPCSGPLLGATLTWSLSQPVPIIFAVFVSIGIGMSLPYLVISFRPSLVSFFPKPGKWTIVFEKIMGLMLLLSAIFFISILRANLILPSIIMLGFAGIATWQLGKFGNPSAPKAKRIFSKFVFIFILVSGLLIPFYYSHINTNDIKSNFTIEQLEINRASGSISVVVFSAEWCLNCRFVEKAVLLTENTAVLLKAINAKIIFADITEHNTEGEKLLHALGSQSIPFLAIFPANDQFNKPVCLRDLYTKKDLVTALELAQTDK